MSGLLHARLDGELDAAQRLTMDSHLRTCAECAGKMESLEALQRTVRAGMRRSQAPERLRQQVRTSIRAAEYLERNPRNTFWRMTIGVAAALLICALLAVPFLLNTRNQKQYIANELLSAHQRALVGRNIDVESSDRHTVRPYFNGKVPYSPPVVDTSSSGFPLLGGRVDSIDGSYVATLVYGRRLHKIDVFVWPVATGKRPEAKFAHTGVNGLSWQDGDFLFTAVSDLNAVELGSFATALGKK